MGYGELMIRSYDAQTDRPQVEDLERRCAVAPSKRALLFTDTMGDPICRIRNSPLYNMLVAELDNELVGVIQGSIKLVTIRKLFKDLTKVGYILGLRVTPIHRRKGIGLRLAQKLEEWFIANDVCYAYMATEKDNEASVKLFINKLSYVKFRTPAILVNPVNKPMYHMSSKIDIVKLKIEEAESTYRKFMASTDLFPNDINNILRNKLSLGTWVAYQRGETWCDFGSGNGGVPNNWAMVSVWNSGELFKLKLEKAPLTCLICTKISRFIDSFFSCFKVPSIPDFLSPFGFYFIYGVHLEGPLSGQLVRTLCQFVHNMATMSKDCKIVVTEVGGSDSLRVHIPHWKTLSCPEDLWCIKALKNEDNNLLYECIKSSPTTNTRALFVDPREV
ncbi:Acetyltransf_1 domain-containing protein [Cephalotus follicularis]|uniref:Acetyltransf_1 domain-containing protein n=1 Tax=Cephalotus follicularis TaxID=3775 RepID=A0A1Q3BFF4_CEPFO|nr:Acetyltransf_1 domain-containing protein [Cephalotus follicularis]